MKFEKRSQFFVGGDDESLSVVAVCISNEDRLSVGINRCDAAPTPTGFAEIVSDDFPELHVDRIVPLLVSTQQSQNDMKGGAMTRATTFAIAAIALLCTAAFHTSSAKKLNVSDPPIITVTGRAFFDIGHALKDQSNRRSHLPGYAAWEIHPVMTLHVDQ